MNRRKLVFVWTIFAGILAAGPGAAVDLDTFAIVDVVEGITITETAALNFGDIALNTGSITVGTDAVVTDPNFLSFDATNVSQGIFTISAVAGATYDIGLLENAPVVGLSLSNFRINIDGGADETGTDNFTAVTLSNTVSTMNVGADLSVDAATASLGDNQMIGYRITVNFN